MSDARHGRSMSAIAICLAAMGLLSVGCGEQTGQSSTPAVAAAQPSAKAETWPSIACEVFGIDARDTTKVASYPRGKGDDVVQLVLSGDVSAASSSGDVVVVTKIASSVLLARMKGLKLSLKALADKHGEPSKVSKQEEDVMSDNFTSSRKTRVSVSYGPLTFLVWDGEDQVHNLTLPVDLFLRLDEIAASAQRGAPGR